VSASYDVGSRVRGIAALLAKPETLLKQFGTLIALRAQRAFKDQKRGTFRWKDRAVPNVPGILSDIRRGKNPPARRFESRPAVVDTGHLAGSIAFRVTGAKTVEVGTVVPYASTQQYGGEVDIPIDMDLKSKIRAFLKKQDRKAQNMARRAFGPVGPRSVDPAKSASADAATAMWKKILGPYLNPKVTAITWNVTPRPFVLVDEQDFKDFRTIIGREIGRATA